MLITHMSVKSLGSIFSKNSLKCMEDLPMSVVTAYIPKGSEVWGVGVPKNFQMGSVFPALGWVGPKMSAWGG